ncbi:MAG: hypothetical protein ACPGQL_00835 [Thermoplasmatota archaeon]
MAQLMSPRQIDPSVLLEFIRRMGYDVDGEYITKEGGPYHDPCTGLPVKFNKMIILQGSAIILDDNPVSLDWYMDEYPGTL